MGQRRPLALHIQSAQLLRPARLDRSSSAWAPGASVRNHGFLSVLHRLVLVGFALCAASCATTPRNPVLDSYPAGVEGRTSVIYYDVSGRTYAELHADMRRLGPKTYGNSYVGETRSPMSWSWRTESTTGGSCTLRDVRVRVNAEILLPRWTPPADADSSVVTEWKRFIAALETHEAGHKDISGRAGRDLKDQLRALTGPCSQVSMRANDIARRIIDDAAQAQKRYDAETRHGLTQGTGFGPAPAAGSGMRGDSAAELVTRLLVTPSALENDQMRLELIGLKRWTVAMIQDSLHRYAPSDSLLSHACAAVLREKLKFADAAVVYRTMVVDGVPARKPYLAVTVIEPQDSALVDYREPFRDSVPTRRAWAPVRRALEEWLRGIAGERTPALDLPS